MSRISLNFNMYPLVVGQFDKYTFSGWQEEGGSIQLEAKLEDTEYGQEDIVWTSDREDVAVVDHGLVHALTVGITDICATLPNGDCAICRIQVIDNVGRITPVTVGLNTDRLILGELEGAWLRPVFFPVDYFDNGMLDTTFTWTSSDPEAVQVNHRGRIFAKACGEAVITGVSNDIGRMVSCQVTVKKRSKAEQTAFPLEDMDGGVCTFKVQETKQLELPQAVRQQEVSWCSVNPSIADVDASGTVTAYRQGQVEIWATFIDGGYRTIYQLDIEELPKPVVSRIELNKCSMTLAAGEQSIVYAAVFPATLLEKQAKWHSSDETVLRIVRQHINLSGLDEVIVEACQEGEAVLTADCDGIKASCSIRVMPQEQRITRIELPPQLTIQMGEVRRLEAVVNADATSQELLWLSGSRRHAAVDREGVLTGYETGTIHIYAIAADSLSEEQQKALKQACEQMEAGESDSLEKLLAGSVYAICEVTVEGQDCLSNLHVPAETVTDSSVCLLWNRKSLADVKQLSEYVIYLNGEETARTKRISYTLKGLQADSPYQVEVAAVDKENRRLHSQTLTIHTKKQPAAVLDVTKAPYCAVGNGIATDTYAIQRAIDDCPKDGIVLLPADYVFLSGALFLKNDMTLQIEGILFGSQDPEDYPPVVCRWEGYRKMCLTEENQAATVPVFDENVYSHSSLINAGVYDEGRPGHLSPVHSENIRICGSGMINANGFMLAYNEGPCWYIYRKGLPCPQSPETDQNIRGRVLAFYNARNVYVADVTVAYGPSWTIHPVFCEEMTFDNLKVVSMGNGRTGVMEGMVTLNGDGIDPDSSTRINIMGCMFTVGDDAVAVKSGRNRQGNELDKPSAYIRVTDCICVDAKGSFCIGSEQAGGAHDILFQNLLVENILHFGLWIKSAPCRGGLVEDVWFRDCLLKDTGGATQIEYNHGGDEDPALVLPVTRRVTYENIHIEGKHKFGIRLIGLKDSLLQNIILRGIYFKDFTARKDPKFYISNCSNVIQTDADLPEGYEWEME